MCEGRKVKVMKRELDGSGYLRSADKVASEPLQLETQHFRQFGQFRLHYPVAVPDNSKEMAHVNYFGNYGLYENTIYRRSLKYRSDRFDTPLVKN